VRPAKKESDRLGPKQETVVILQLRKAMLFEESLKVQSLFLSKNIAERIG
jgi:hypothetical protein